MKPTIIYALLLLCCLTGTTYGQDQDNTLTAQEKAAGWTLLFNGKNLDGWTSQTGQDPQTDWNVADGILSIKPENKKHLDMITTAEYSDFDLRVDFKLTEGANSGIKYFFVKYDTGGWLGMEYQIIDNLQHPDAKLGRDGNRQLGTLYDMLPLAKKTEVNVGEWSHARIVAKGSKVTHYVNGQEVLSFDRKSTDFEKARLLSKFIDAKPAFGSVSKGHIMLQDHGDVVFFKNVKIKTL